MISKIHCMKWIFIKTVCLFKINEEWSQSGRNLQNTVVLTQKIMKVINISSKKVWVFLKLTLICCSKIAL